MGIISSKIWLGVDWGTHSSKWACYVTESDAPLFQLHSDMHRSTLARIGEDLIFSNVDIPKVDVIIDALKRKIIQDPLGQSFWDADREDTRTSLGEAVSFSFCALLSDIVRATIEKGKLYFFTPDLALEIGFSHPNWLKEHDKESETAFKHFSQAVSVSCWIFKKTLGIDIPFPKEGFSIRRWKQLVGKALEAGCCDEKNSPIQHTNDLYSFEGLEWRCLIESCAAGLPYLRSIRLSIDDEAPALLSGLGKLLVVDVGAGSTDVGYMIRTLGRDRSENLFYFPPAATFDVAGNNLTDKIREYYEQQGTRLTLSEAENSKLRDTTWCELEFVNEWRSQIRKHVKQYVEGITDRRWLPLEVPLQVIVTGGSGVVQGLKEDIKAGICDGLRKLGVSANTINKTTLINEKLQNWNFAEEAEYARRAVSIGAADTDKPALKSCPELDPPVRIDTRTIRY